MSNIKVVSKVRTKVVKNTKEKTKVVRVGLTGPQGPSGEVSISGGIATINDVIPDNTGNMDINIEGFTKSSNGDGDIQYEIDVLPAAGVSDVNGITGAVEIVGENIGVSPNGQQLELSIDDYISKTEVADISGDLQDQIDNIPPSETTVRGGEGILSTQNSFNDYTISVSGDYASSGDVDQLRTEVEDATGVNAAAIVINSGDISQLRTETESATATNAAAIAVNSAAISVNASDIAQLRSETEAATATNAADILTNSGDIFQLRTEVEDATGNLQNQIDNIEADVTIVGTNGISAEEFSPGVFVIGVSADYAEQFELDLVEAKVDQNVIDISANTAAIENITSNPQGFVPLEGTGMDINAEGDDYRFNVIDYVSKTEVAAATAANALDIYNLDLSTTAGILQNANNIAALSVATSAATADLQEQIDGLEADVTIVGTNGISATEGPTNTFTIGVSADYATSAELDVVDAKVDQNIVDISNLRSETEAATATNAAAILVNAGDISQNASDIAQLRSETESATATNAAAIAINAADIATNASDILDLRTETAAATATNAAAIAVNAGHIATLQNEISDKVDGPASAQDNTIAFFDGTTGKLIKDNNKTISTAVNANSNDDQIPTTLAVNNAILQNCSNFHPDRTYVFDYENDNGFTAVNSSITGVDDYILMEWTDATDPYIRLINSDLEVDRKKNKYISITTTEDTEIIDPFVSIFVGSSASDPNTLVGTFSHRLKNVSGQATTNIYEIPDNIGIDTIRSIRLDFGNSSPANDNKSIKIHNISFGSIGQPQEPSTGGGGTAEFDRGEIAKMILVYGGE